MAWTWSILDSGNHDLMIRRGKLLTVQGAEEVKQRILIALLHHWNEYFLNVPSGVPWYEVILGSKDKKLVQLILRSAVLEVPGVLSVVGCQVRFDTNRSVFVEIVAEVEDATQPITVQAMMGTEEAQINV